MAWWLPCAILCVASTSVAGNVLINRQAGVSLAVPEGWATRAVRGSRSLVPTANLLEELPRRRIHIVIAQGQPSTLEEAMNAETDRITQRSPPWGSSNDHNHFLGASPVTTRSGLSGLAARFGSGGEANRQYTINKYYFRSANGKVFVVCIHVWGDRTVADEYGKLVLERLRVR